MLGITSGVRLVRNNLNRVSRPPGGKSLRDLHDREGGFRFHYTDQIINTAWPGSNALQVLSVRVIILPVGPVIKGLNSSCKSS